jgi:hypothetical protein
MEFIIEIVSRAHFSRVWNNIDKISVNLMGRFEKLDAHELPSKTV